MANPWVPGGAGREPKKEGRQLPALYLSRTWKEPARAGSFDFMAFFAFYIRMVTVRAALTQKRVGPDPSRFFLSAEAHRQGQKIYFSYAIFQMAK
ncbi:hypothetical protein [Paenibacillus dendritiformis]|uniref:hypothetical protein n=1 Tax=Paenibacillus dendritiformis TaxID=130049 RepID=UPI000DA6F4E1|nr:hypothetical protein [Paenibacillus dendritiformis]PZM63720.1 hypothetical protein DOE73_20555 [Paenibacillus dendritiformis]